MRGDSERLVRVPAGTPYRLQGGSLRYGRVKQEMVVEAVVIDQGTGLGFELDGQPVSVPAKACQVLGEEEE